MLDLTDEELKKLNNFKKKNDIDDEVAEFTEQVLEMYEEMLCFTKYNALEIFTKFQFHGFYSEGCTHDESEYYNYADYLIFTLDKYPTLRSITRFDNIRAEIFQNFTYINQLNIWKKHHKPNSEAMTKEIIEKILNA